MLKIPKGLKKKKKDKKKKRKEDDLFNEEELEKYRKNRVDCGDAHTAQSSNSSEQNDEWQKFKALTAGVDTILQKTQEDLDRIKSTSFFQRKAPPSEVEKQKEEYNSENQQNIKENHGNSEQHTNNNQQKSDGEVGYHDKSESENELDELVVDDTLFDTSYVDAVASGELKLAYIPDSPPNYEEDFDLFDTSYANKFIESNPKKRYLNLGCAVQVLSGRESSSTSSLAPIEKKSHRYRPKPVDLLLTSFDENVDTKSPTIPASTVVERTPIDSPVKTLLDEDPVFVTDENFDTVPLAITPIPPAPPTSTPTNPATDEENGKQLRLNLSDFELTEFDISIPTTVTTTDIANFQKHPSNESTDDEFAQLAAESLARKSSVIQPIPKDLTIAQQTLIESSLDAVSPNIAADLLQPVGPNHMEEIDPFDTSIVAKVILPGKQEIRLLEQELLSDITQVCQIVPALPDVDEDFDPRAGECTQIKVIRPQELLIKNIAQVEKSISPSKKLDLLKIEEIDVEVVKPLTPFTVTEQDQSANEEYDPFDTSHISGAPGKLELKLIESELTEKDINSVDKKKDNDDDDDDFDPRKYEKNDGLQTIGNPLTCHILNKYCCNPDIQQQIKELTTIDILTGKEEGEDQLHSLSIPVELGKYTANSPDIASYCDPFDTSIADNIQPGKVELKLLETELITNN